MTQLSGADTSDEAEFTSLWSSLKATGVREGGDFVGDCEVVGSERCTVGVLMMRIELFTS